MWESLPVAPGDDAKAEQYNKLRNDAFYPIYQSFTYGETIAVNNALYLKIDDGKVYKASALIYSEDKISNFVGFAKEAGGLNDVKKVQVQGVVSGFSGLIPGIKYFLSDTAGAIGIVPGTYEYQIGIAISSSKLFLLPSLRIPASLFIITDNLRHSNDTLRSLPATVITYTKIKECKLYYDLPTCCIKFKLSFGGLSYSTDRIFARVYRNGTPIGTEFSILRVEYTSYVFTEDFPTLNAVKNDLIQIYGRHKTDNHPQCLLEISDFRFYFDRRIKTIFNWELETPISVKTPVLALNQDP